MEGNYYFLIVRILNIFKLQNLLNKLKLYYDYNINKLSKAKQCVTRFNFYRTQDDAVKVKLITFPKYKMFKPLKPVDIFEN